MFLVAAWIARHFMHCYANYVRSAALDPSPVKVWSE